ncbi:hypothetical protein Z945_3767 [Sulfitobacter noctilucae]|uniref:hypothetical protein n=1 Tax=Sulfitobacter noctilucae TaxID=1342302 RepID=UPI000469F46F|nr:hypothetical protein [Sulfitobacter noctilucae]KIN69875.1 hypothetical protein Z945_3767 [Sulfitobacter noctilucae]
MKFDPYEYIGVVVPGSVLVLAIALIFPDLVPSITSSLSLGDLGLMVILAFVAGHFVQAGGNLWETIVWKLLGGMPSSSVFKPNSRLLSPGQQERLKSKLTDDFGPDAREGLAVGRGAMRELFVKVRQSGSIDRIEKFNRNYGLMRGTAVSFLVSAALVLVFDPDHTEIALLLLGVAGVFTYRMVRFGKHYAREAFAEYLRISSAKDTD